MSMHPLVIRPIRFAISYFSQFLSVSLFISLSCVSLSLSLSVCLCVCVCNHHIVQSPPHRLALCESLNNKRVWLPFFLSLSLSDFSSSSCQMTRRATAIWEKSWRVPKVRLKEKKEQKEKKKKNKEEKTNYLFIRASHHRRMA